MKILKRIKLSNFKRFPSFDVPLDEALNVLIGDNESGKSTILTALDLVLSGNRAKVETVGLESLLNSAAVAQFMAGTKRFEDLPTLYVEVYLTEQNAPDLNGKNNSDGVVCDGLTMVCEPLDGYGKEIGEMLAQDDASFPFEYYDTKFFTFSGKSYTGNTRPIRHLVIDSAHVSNEYATRSYVRDLYDSNVEEVEKHRHKSEYRRHKEGFQRDVLGDVNARLEKYDFTLRTAGKATLESDLTISEGGVTIDHKGKGQQCFIKTAFALKKPATKGNIDVLLLEEPENHLSHVNMRRLIGRITATIDKQLFVATHSNMVSARLDLRKCILLNSGGTQSARLADLPSDTAEFFMKAPDNNILEFILSERVILVEGDAEYILLESFYRAVAGDAPDSDSVHVISIGGTSFKRYLDLAKLLGIKTAVIRDNDHDYQQNCVDRYTAYDGPCVKVFADQDDSRHTFEVCLYEDNRSICEIAFAEGRKTLSVQDYMLHNKSEAAFQLLKHHADALSPPDYIREAIEWVRK